MSLPPAYRKILFNNPADPTTWNVNQNIKNLVVQTDEDGNIIAIPTFSVNPASNPITASGTLGNVSIKDPTSSSLVNVVTGIGIGTGLGTKSWLLTGAIPLLADYSIPGYDELEIATAMASASQSGAGSTQILAAGGAGKVYRIFGGILSYNTTVAVAANVVSINEVTSGAVIAQLAVGAVGASSVAFQCGPGGILQPNTNNAIQVTSVATTDASATLFYGVAR